MSYALRANPNMKGNGGFDEVMIVNPYDPRSNNQQHLQFMRFHELPGYYGGPAYGAYPEPEQMAYYGGPGYGAYPEPEQMAYYGGPGYGAYPEPEQMAYYGGPGYGAYPEPEQMAYYGGPGYGAYPEPEQMAYYGGPGYGAYPEPEQMAYYGGPGYGAYPEPEQMAYYGGPGYGAYPEPEQMAYYGGPGYDAYAEPAMGAHEPVGYISEEQRMGSYPVPEMAGYADNQPLADPYPEGVGYYGDPNISGYVRETATPLYNPGCPMPTNVAGFGDSEQLAGYQRPATVNPTCEQFVPQPGITEAVPETFKPLW